MSIQGRTHDGGAPGVPPSLDEEIVVDLTRSVWLIEKARASVYAAWAKSEPRWRDQERLTTLRAAVIEETLRRRRRAPSEGIVDEYSAWLAHLVGATPHEVSLGPLFLQRLGEWVNAYAADHLDGGGDRLIALRDEGEGPSLPAELPPPPPFEPISTANASAPGPVRFRFAILGDLHAGSGRDDTILAAIEDINRSGAELTVQLGDLTETGEEIEWRSAAALLGKLEMPLITMMGNHDVVTRRDGRLRGRALFESYFGRPPDGVLTSHRGVRFAALDSADHRVSPYPPFDFLTGTFADGPPEAVHRGMLSVEQHEILAELAAPGSGPAFLFLHHPPQPFMGFPPIVFGLRAADSGRLHATCDSGNVWGVFAGHTHRNATGHPFGDVPVQEVAIPRDFPHGYALVDVAENGYLYRFHQVSDTDLLRALTPTTDIQRRYGLGSERDRCFAWTRGNGKVQ